MKKKFIYTFQAFQKDHFWLPPAFMALFLIIITMIGDTNRYNTARAFLGFLMPLISGGLASYAFLEDKALEMQFSMRRSIWKMILERLGIIFLVYAGTAVFFQLCVHIMGISLSPLGNLFERQLVWLIPSITSMFLAAFVSLLGRSSNSGFALIGGLWILQLILRGWFARHTILRNILFFYGVMDPMGKPLPGNQLTLSIISVTCLVLIYIFLNKHERYI